MGPLLWPKKENNMKDKNIFELVLTSTFVSIILIMSLIPQLGFVTILPGVSITLVHIPTMIGIFILRPKYGLILGLAFGLGSFFASLMYASTPFDLAFQNPIISVIPRALFGLSAWAIFQGFMKLRKLSYGKYIMFGLVTLITTFAVYFGTIQITKNVVWNKYTTEAAKEVPNDALLLLYEQEALANEGPAINMIIPIALVIIVVFISVYFYLVSKENYGDLSVSSSFILGTLAHTVLVLTFVILFAEAFKMAFGDAVTLIYGIAASNGLVEALAAVAIGTPIYTALSRLPVVQANFKHMK